MVLHQYYNASILEQKIQEFWSLYKTDLLKLSRDSWKQEDLRGQSYTQWKIMQYYNILSLVILLYFDVLKNGTVYTTWSYYNTKYNLDEVRKCAACNCIDLDKILAIFGFPFNDCIGGIECMRIETPEIESTFIVEGEEECPSNENLRIRVIVDRTPRIDQDINYRYIQ